MFVLSSLNQSYHNDETLYSLSQPGLGTWIKNCWRRSTLIVDVMPDEEEVTMNSEVPFRITVDVDFDVGETLDDSHVAILFALAALVN